MGWEAIPNSIQQGTWCPFCPKYKREKLCREILTEYLGSPSLIRRPGFLKTQEYPNGLELDIPYYEYGFAIEVQGVQHEKYASTGSTQERIMRRESDCLEVCLVL